MSGALRTSAAVPFASHLGKLFVAINSEVAISIYVCVEPLHPVVLINN